MPQNSEARTFLQRIEALREGPGVSLDPVLQPSLEDEAQLRRLFATDKNNERLKDPYVGLVDVFDAPPSIRTIRARVVKDEEDLSAKYVMPLADLDRKKEGEACMVPTLDEFKENWAIFTEGSLSQLKDWSNVVAAGGSVLACLQPLPQETEDSKRSVRKWYHEMSYPTSDVDLFLWGLTPAQAEAKIIKIYQAVRDSVPWDITCVRTKHTISIHSQYPIRSVQIILRLYTSPAEVLAGFDIDAPCCAYDGTHVYANPRSIVAMMRQCNTVDMSRRSPSYEVRLAKYNSRSFEIYVPTLSRKDIDPTIYERSIVRIEGLARLLVFEKLKDADRRSRFLESRRTLRGRLESSKSGHYRRKRTYKGDLKNVQSIGGLEMNDYDVQSLHIPYGPGWDARRIDKLVYSTDLSMNSTFNPKNKNRRLHRHPAFFGTAQECMEDCCEHCPTPIDEDERKLQKEEDKQYIRGRIVFIQEDPGRQSISGSFNPIDVGEWSAQVYVGLAEKLFAAIVAHDRFLVSKIITGGIDVNRRDHVGRTPLHVAVLVKAEDIACDLIDAGARITCRLPEGRTALHCAAQLDLVKVVKKLLERSRMNREGLAKKKADEDGDVEMKGKTEDRLSSGDDWSSDDNNGIESMDEDENMGDSENEDEDKSKDNTQRKGQDEGVKMLPKETVREPQTLDESGALPEDDEGEPDVNAPDWDLSFTPLVYAILFASPAVIEELVAAGADFNLVRIPSPRHRYYYHSNAPLMHPLLLTVYRENEDEACRVIQALIKAGVVSSAADERMKTLFHQMVEANKAKLVNAILCWDPKAATVLNLPSLGNGYIFPIVTSVALGNYSMVATLLAYGANIVLKEEDVSRALSLISNYRQNRKYNVQPQYSQTQTSKSFEQTLHPLEVSIRGHSDLFQLLIALGAEVNTPPKHVFSDNRDDHRRSLLDWVRFAVATIDQKLDMIKERDDEADKERQKLLHISFAENATEGKQYIAQCLTDLRVYTQEPRKRTKTLDKEKKNREQQHQEYLEIKNFFSDVEKALLSRNANTYYEIYPEIEKKSSSSPYRYDWDINRNSYKPTSDARFRTLVSRYHTGEPVPSHLNDKYDELFAACFDGDNETVQKLCLPELGAEESSEELLQISVEAATPLSGWGTGITPFSAAVAGGRWDTVRLVFNIAVAQYEPIKVETRFKLGSFQLYNDDSDDETESDDSDDTVYGKLKINLMDIDRHLSAVKCSCPPSKMLQDCPITFHIKGMGKVDIPLRKAVVEKDLEAFVQIANLYKLASPPIDLGSKVLDLILDTDQPDMLDEYIRRTGKGIDIQWSTDKEGEQDVTAVNDTNKIYLGLSVHGIKRKDLAKKNGPNAMDYYDAVCTPLVWRACDPGSPKILVYLSSSRPLEAYRYYAMTNSDELAIRLHRMGDLEKVLPELLGWNINRFGESFLTAAILGGKLKIIKKLFKMQPKLISTVLKERIKWTGFNALMVALHTECDTATVDFLLANGQSPVEKDKVRGWNIYHIMAAYHRCILFKHLLRTLPRDVNDSLLNQQSKDSLSTPLHIAVSEGLYCIVEAIIDYTNSGLLIRNVYGSFPLHMAVRKGFPKITQKLADAATPEALCAENGVGHTPLEIAVLKKLSSLVGVPLLRVDELSATDVPTSPPRFNLKRLEKNIQELWEMIEQLKADGKLKPGEKLMDELVSFARLMETRLGEAKAKTTVTKKTVGEEDKCSKESVDSPATLRILRESIITRPAQRQLVHLVDVQRSVGSALKEASDNKPSYRRRLRRNDEGLEPAEDTEYLQRTRSIVNQKIGTLKRDTYQ